MSSANRITWMQKRQDEEKLSQILYQGQLIHMEADVYKSQLNSVRKMKQYDFSSQNLVKSHSHLHLPPIKPAGDPQTKSFLNELRHRDYKKYLESLKIVKQNEEQRSSNEILKDKLFRLKFKHYNNSAKDVAHHQWNKLESITKLYPDGLEYRTGGGLSSKQGQKPKNAASYQSGSMTERPPGATVNPVSNQQSAMASKPGQAQISQKQPATDMGKKAANNKEPENEY